jgi:hypothetical protein
MGVPSEPEDMPADFIGFLEGLLAEAPAAAQDTAAEPPPGTGAAPLGQLLPLPPAQQQHMLGGAGAGVPGAAANPAAAAESDDDDELPLLGGAQQAANPITRSLQAAQQRAEELRYRLPKVAAGLHGESSIAMLEDLTRSIKARNAAQGLAGQHLVSVAWQRAGSGSAACCTCW